MIIGSFFTHKVINKNRKIEGNEKLSAIEKEIKHDDKDELEGEEIELEDDKNNVSDYLMSLYYVVYEEIHEGKKAIWRGKVTQHFLDWYESIVN